MKQPVPVARIGEHALSVSGASGGNAGECRGEVVGGVEQEPELRGRGVRAAGLEQIGRAEDHQRRGEVPQLEGSRGREEAAEPTVHERPDAQADRLVVAHGERGGVADRVDDRERGEQAGDDREQDRRAHADQPDERDGEQWAADRAEVVHRAVEAVGAAVGGGGDHVGEQRVAGGNA